MKNHLIILLDGKKEHLTKSNSHSNFFLKILSKLGMEKNLLNLIKNICKKKKKPIANVILHYENLNTLHPETGKKAKMCHLINYSQYHMGSPS